MGDKQGHGCRIFRGSIWWCRGRCIPCASRVGRVIHGEGAIDSVDVRWPQRCGESGRLRLGRGWAGEPQGPWDEDGYLADKGLVPLPDDELAKVRSTVLGKLK